MFCSNCGNKLESDALFCGECGSKVLGDYNLIVSRPGTVMGFAVSLHVEVADKSFDLNAGNSVNLKLEPGTYKLTYKIWCRRLQSVDVVIEEGKISSVIFEYDALWGGFKVSKSSNL